MTCRIASTTGRNVIPSPYGGQRPRSTVARSPSAATKASSRRDFPTPPTPSTVNSWHAWSETVRSNAPSKQRQLPRPAHHGCVEPAGEPRSVRVDLHHPVGEERFLLALDRQRIARLREHRVTDELVGAGADQDLPRLGGLLQPGRHVDRVAGGDRPVGLVGDHHLAGVDPRADADAHAVRRLQIGVQLVEGVAHLRRRADGPQRVVLPDPRDPEHRHHGVADELLHRAAVPLDHGSHRVEVAREDDLEPLRVEAFAELASSPRCRRTGSSRSCEHPMASPRPAPRHTPGRTRSPRAPHVRSSRTCSPGEPTLVPGLTHDGAAGADQAHPGPCG